METQYNLLILTVVEFSLELKYENILINSNTNVQFFLKFQFIIDR